MRNIYEKEHFEVRVRHHKPGHDRYTWRIYQDDELLPINESRVGYRSWQEANDAGKEALNKIYLANVRALKFGRSRS